MKNEPYKSVEDYYTDPFYKDPTILSLVGFFVILTIGMVLLSFI
jgi:hypothetical protein